MIFQINITTLLFQNVSFYTAVVNLTTFNLFYIRQLAMLFFSLEL